MQPFYFGTSEQQLFGVYHAAESSSSKRAGVVLCPPVGHEYLRAHRAFRNLAVMLSSQGFHVLRFDYFATGDSAGDAERLTVRQCLSDLEVAIDELKDIAGVTRVSLVGLRLGATFAALAAARRSDVNRLILWDPVLDGGVYIAELEALQRRWVEDRLGARARIEREHEELIGLPLPEALRRELGRTMLTAASGFGRTPVALLASQEGHGYQAFHDELAAARGPVSLAVVPGSADWNNGELVHQILLPHAMLKTIASGLAG
jgi:pimeloyl-ACP methyl ester carboxylesterase